MSEEEINQDKEQVYKEEEEINTHSHSENVNNNRSNEDSQNENLNLQISSEQNKLDASLKSADSLIQPLSENSFKKESFDSNSKFDSSLDLSRKESSSSNPSNSIILQKNESDSNVQEYKNSLLKRSDLTYYCPYCKRPQKIEMTKDFNVQVTCNSDDCGYRNYTVNLETFIKSLETPKEPAFCSETEKHLNKPEKAMFYCTEHNQFYCSNCWKDHNLQFSDHITIVSDGMVVSSMCQNSKCERKAKFYCDKCNKHLCEKCKHYEDPRMVDRPDSEKMHNNVNIMELIDYELLGNWNAKLQEVTENFTKDYEHYEKYIKRLERMITKAKDSLKKKREEDENILKYFKTLLFTFYSAKDVLDFNIRNNLIINDLEQAYKNKKEAFEGKINATLHIDPLDDFTQEFFLGDYEVTTTDEPTQILGDKFTGLSDDNCTLNINGKQVPFVKKYQFKFKGKYKVKVVLKQGTVLKNMAYMFYDCSTLNVLNLNINTDKVTDMNHMFHSCTNLSKMKLSNFNTSNVKSMNHMFAGCSTLKNLNLTQFKTDTVTDMSYMFYKCTGLIKVDLSSFKTDNVTDLKWMFNGCIALKSLDVSNFNTDKLITMDCMFYECTKLYDLKMFEVDEEKNPSRNWVFNGSPRISPEIKAKYQKK